MDPGGLFFAPPCCLDRRYRLQPELFEPLVEMVAGLDGRVLASRLLGREWPARLEHHVFLHVPVQRRPDEPVILRFVLAIAIDPRVDDGHRFGHDDRLLQRSPDYSPCEVFELLARDDEQVGSRKTNDVRHAVARRPYHVARVVRFAEDTDQVEVGLAARERTTVEAVLLHVRCRCSEPMSSLPDVLYEEVLVEVVSDCEHPQDHDEDVDLLEGCRHDDVFPDVVLAEHFGDFEPASAGSELHEDTLLGIGAGGELGPRLRFDSAEHGLVESRYLLPARRPAELVCWWIDVRLLHVFRLQEVGLPRGQIGSGHRASDRRFVDHERAAFLERRHDLPARGICPRVREPVLADSLQTDDRNSWRSLHRCLFLPYNCNRAECMFDATVFGAEDQVPGLVSGIMYYVLGIKQAVRCYWIM